MVLCCVLFPKTLRSIRKKGFIMPKKLRNSGLQYELSLQIARGWSGSQAGVGASKHKPRHPTGSPHKGQTDVCPLSTDRHDLTIQILKTSENTSSWPKIILSLATKLYRVGEYILRARKEVNIHQTK